MSNGYSSWRLVHGEYRCPKCLVPPLKTAHSLSAHLSSTHPGLGIRERSLILTKARQDNGWPKARGRYAPPTELRRLP